MSAFASAFVSIRNWYSAVLLRRAPAVSAGLVRGLMFRASVVPPCDAKA